MSYLALPSKTQGKTIYVGSTSLSVIHTADILNHMSTVAEIEAAIERLPEPQVEELVAWLQKFRSERAAPPAVEHWLASARGAARPGVNTDALLSTTRGEE